MLWTHRGGHVEKVKLPEFHGNIEDYPEFKSQFQQLCQGEGYSPVIELAQLRSKLPKDAITAIIGQTVPEKAWERLDELYGNCLLGDGSESPGDLCLDTYKYCVAFVIDQLE